MSMRKSRKNTSPYLSIVQQYSRLFARSRDLQPHAVPAQTGKRDNNKPVALILAPHPDDECLMGGLALRLQREKGYQTIVVPVTLGSRVDRRQARMRELKAACRSLGFHLAVLPGGSLEGINREERQRHPGRWRQHVDVLSKLLHHLNPLLILFPHDQDGNRTHAGVHLLTMDALRLLGPRLTCGVALTEYWTPMQEPNFILEVSAEDLADLMSALACHRGEVARNAYHARLPAWMMDNVRRGSEQIHGQGGEGLNMTFAVLYRLMRWNGKKLTLGIPELQRQPARHPSLRSKRRAAKSSP